MIVLLYRFMDVDDRSGDDRWQIFDDDDLDKAKEYAEAYRKNPDYSFDYLIKGEVVME